MIQNTTLTITQADMCIALAYWLNATTMKESVEVTNVKTESKNYGTEHFTCDVKRLTHTEPKGNE